MSEKANTTVYLVRHASTDWNDEGRWQCLDDRPIGENGIKQAKSVAAWIAGIHKTKPFAALYSSPFTRARQTAREISDSIGLGVVDEPLLREFDCGHISGLRFEEARRIHAGFLGRLDENWLDERYPGGETNREYWNSAVSPGLAKLHDAHRGASVVAVTHGGFIRAAVMQVMGCPTHRPIRGLAIDNCACFILEIDGMDKQGFITGRASQLNITSYLRRGTALDQGGAGK